MPQTGLLSITARRAELLNLVSKQRTQGQIADAMEITPATVKSHNPNPQGFLKDVRYEHWDTLYGYVDSGGIEYAKVGQVYGASLFGDGTPQGQYQQYQDIPWNTQWLAIGSWNGIVW